MAPTTLRQAVTQPEPVTTLRSTAAAASSPPQIADVVRIFIGNGTPESPNAGLLIGDG